MSALQGQQDGTHYIEMKLQPVELAYRLGATPCFCKLAKYLTRNKGDKLVNLRKARHCIELEVSQQGYMWRYPTPYSFHTVYDVARQIDTFTDDIMIYSALLAMYQREYKSALESVDYIIERYLEGASNG